MVWRDVPACAFQYRSATVRQRRFRRVGSRVIRRRLTALRPNIPPSKSSIPLAEQRRRRFCKTAEAGAYADLKIMRTEVLDGFGFPDSAAQRSPHNHQRFSKNARRRSLALKRVAFVLGDWSLCKQRSFIRRSNSTY